MWCENWRQNTYTLLFVDFHLVALTTNTFAKDGESNGSFNPLVPNVPFFYPPETSQKGGGREKVHREQMG